MALGNAFCNGGSNAERLQTGLTPDLSNQGRISLPPLNVAANLSDTRAGKQAVRPPGDRAPASGLRFCSVFEECKYVLWKVCIAPSGFCMCQHFKGRTTHTHIHPCSTKHFNFLCICLYNFYIYTSWINRLKPSVCLFFKWESAPNLSHKMIDNILLSVVFIVAFFYFYIPYCFASVCSRFKIHLGCFKLADNWAVHFQKKPIAHRQEREQMPITKTTV